MPIVLGFTWILLMQLTGEIISMYFKLPVPGPVIGLFIYLVLLFYPPIRRATIFASHHLLMIMPMLFVPIGVSIIQFKQQLIEHGIAFLGILIVSTWIGLIVTAVVLSLINRFFPAPTQEEPQS